MRYHYSPLYTDALSPHVRFPRMRYRLVREELARRGAPDPLHARAATRTELITAHDPDYVDAFLRGDLDPKAIRRIGFRPWTPDFVARTLAITGASLQALEALLEGDAIAGNLAGGTHHAFYAHGEGYCVFNDIAVCIERARAEGLERFLVVDLDVHQGNGTASMFAEDADVFTFSMHGAKNYPYRKQTSDLDLELADGTGDDAYLALLEEHLPRLMYEHRPELVVYQAGVDALREDGLGRLAMSRAGLARRNALVFDYASYWSCPVLVLMGGGYAEPIEASVAAHADLFEEAVRRLS